MESSIERPRPRVWRALASDTTFPEMSCLAAPAVFYKQQSQMWARTLPTTKYDHKHHQQPNINININNLTTSMNTNITNKYEHKYYQHPSINTKITNKHEHKYFQHYQQVWTQTLPTSINTNITNTHVWTQTLPILKYEHKHYQQPSVDSKRKRSIVPKLI